MLGVRDGVIEKKARDAVAATGEDLFVPGFEDFCVGGLGQILLYQAATEQDIFHRYGAQLLHLMDEDRERDAGGLDGPVGKLRRTARLLRSEILILIVIGVGIFHGGTSTLNFTAGPAAKQIVTLILILVKK